MFKFSTIASMISEQGSSALRLLTKCIAANTLAASFILPFSSNFVRFDFKEALDLVFSDQEMAIVASIIGFYFGSRHWKN